MNSKPYEVKLSPKIEKWFKELSKNQADLSIHLLELVIEGELKSNPYPRPENPKLIKVLKGLKKGNPKCYRLRVYKDASKKAYDEYRFYYSITTPHANEKEYSGYVILLEVSNPSDKDKKQAIERLKKLNNTKFQDLIELIIE